MSRVNAWFDGLSVGRSAASHADHSELDHRYTATVAVKVADKNEASVWRNRYGSGLWSGLERLQELNRRIAVFIDDPHQYAIVTRHEKKATVRRDRQTKSIGSGA
jgi:hypothetical protein